MVRNDSVKSSIVRAYKKAVLVTKNFFINVMLAAKEITRKVK